MKKVTILFLLRGDEILLAMKKRGFGAGKWNGCGGKVEAGETVQQAAIREAQEEIGVTPRNPRLVGTLEFRMSHDSSFGHHAHIYVATAWDGEPYETEEMRPQWFHRDAIPYAQMWADDIEWLPLLLAGKRFRGAITIGPDGQVVQSVVQ
jgi:mutator protein MutT